MKIRGKVKMFNRSEKASQNGEVYVTCNISSGKKVNDKYVNCNFNAVAFKFTAQKLLQMDENSLFWFEGEVQDNNYEKDGQTVYNKKVMIYEVHELAEPRQFDYEKPLPGYNPQVLINDDDLPF